MIIGCAILHEDPTNQVRTVQTDLNIVLIVKGHVREDSQHGSNQVWIISVGVYLQHIKDEVDEV